MKLNQRSFNMNKYCVVLLIAVLCVNNSFKVSASTGPTGCVQLDEHTFDKLISKFDATLVKFDVAFPYGDKHDAYTALSKNAKSADGLLVAEVGVKDYGEKDNEELAKKYNVKKEDYPVVKLFLKGQKDPITYSDEFTVESLRKFVKEKAGIHLSLPGCISSLDNIAVKFALVNNDVRKSLVKEAEEIIRGLDEKEKKTGKIYKSVMEKIIEKGLEFVKNEDARVKKLLSGKITQDKQKELTNKINILLSFSQDEFKKKDEL